MLPATDAHVSRIVARGDEGMISLNNVGSAGQALHYFSKDNYYTQDQGLEHSEWFGNGAEHLGLSGQIDRAAFFEQIGSTRLKSSHGTFTRMPSSA